MNEIDWWHDDGITFFFYGIFVLTLAEMIPRH